LVAFVVAVFGCSAGAQSKATLEVSETLFSVLSAINVCGYDHELSASSPIRAQVRVALVAASESPEAAAAAQKMCKFYQDHRSPDSGRQLTEYVSLALNLGDPPNFVPKYQEADLPPDASYVLGFVPLLKEYAARAKLHAIWLDHQAQYEALVDQFHDPVARMITSTDAYLRMPSSGYLGRSYTVYLDPMAAPGQVNSRNYQADYYYVVVSPANDEIHMNQLRHTYLHYSLEPLITKRATTLARLKPILASVQKAPMAPEDKTDIGLLVIESLIRAIEARSPLDPKLPEKERIAMVNRDEAEGFVLTNYFYEQLKEFEKDSTGMKDAFPNWLHDIDVDRIKKKAGEIQFAAQAAPDVVRSGAPKPDSKIDQAERALSSGNPAGAVQLAQAALAQNEDAGRCYFVLARAATLSANMQEAKDDFVKAAASSKDPRTVAWSHIYLGRILDLQDEREAAVEQYKAALAASDLSPDTRAAAERGLQTPYEPPEASQKPKSQ
jgi:tetratricopeptide (TPR) repeat protein